MALEQDEIIREVRAIREAYAERFGFDIDALCRDAKATEGRDGREVVHLEPRLVEPRAGGQGKADEALAEVEP